MAVTFKSQLKRKLHSWILLKLRRALLFLSSHPTHCGDPMNLVVLPLPGPPADKTTHSVKPS